MKSITASFGNTTQTLPRKSRRAPAERTAALCGERRSPHSAIPKLHPVGRLFIVPRVKASPSVSILFCLLLALGVGGCGADPDARARKGIQALNEGNYSKAVRHLERAVDLPEDQTAPGPVWNALGLARYRAKNVPAAEEALRRAVEASPDAYLPRYNLGDLLTQEGRYEEARPILEQAASLDPDRTEALQTLAFIALHNQEFGRAVDLLERARARRETAPVLTMLAAARRHSLPVADIRDLLQRAVTLDPSYAPARHNLASLLDQNRLDPLQAISHYEAFLRLRPDTVKAPQIRQRIQVMAAREDSGAVARPDPARREVESLLKQASEAAGNGSPEQALHYCLRANAVAGRAQRTDLKERALRAAAALAPESARSHYGLGTFLLSQDRPADALDALETAHRLAPAWPGALRSTVAAARRAGNTDAARDALQRAAEAAGDNANLLLLIGRIYENDLQDPRRARRIYRTWLERFPDDPRAADISARIDR